MENYSIITSNKEEKDATAWWEDKKKKLLENINTTLEKSSSETTDILELMKSMIEKAKIRNSISSYYDEQI